MKKTFLHIIVAFLICSVMLPCFYSCRDENKEQEKTETEKIDIIKDGKSDYKIVSNSSDALASYVADGVWAVLYNAYSVSLEKKSDKEQHDYEIVVGNAARDAVPELANKLKEKDDFVISQSGNRIYLFANTFTGSKKMLLALRDHIFLGSEQKELSIEKDYFCLGSTQAETFANGNSVELFADGKSNYTIVYNSKNENDEAVAYCLRRAIQDISGVKLNISDYQKSNSEYEIVIGSGTIKHDEYATVRKNLKGRENFILAVNGNKLILTATDEMTLLQGVEYLNSVHLKNAKDGACRVYECDELYSQLDLKGFTLTHERLVELYVDVFDLYPTMYELAKKEEVSGKGNSDQQMVEALVERLGVGFVLYEGSSSALHDGMICKLDKNDYSRKASLSASAATVPSAFANAYFGTSYAIGTDVDLKSIAESAGYTYEYDSSRKLAIISPPGTTSFTTDAEKIGKYTNGQLKDRMVGFFANPAMPEPQNNTEQSRVVIGDAVDYYPENSFDYTQPTYTCYYSPSILTVGDAIYTSVEHCKVKNGDELSSKTVIRKSLDGGATWEITHEIDRLKWAALFTVEDQLYIVGFLKNDGAWTGGTWIGKVTDDQNSNTVEAVSMKKLWDAHSAVFEPLVSDGILYFPMDSFVASASITSDLTVASNWTRTQDSATLIDKAWFNSVTGKTLGGLGTAECLEGNMLKGKDCEMYVMYRIESHPYGNYAILLKLSDDRTTLERLPGNGSVIDLPTTVSRFVIKYDEVSKKYICISNWYLTEDACRARNVLGISVSDDLTNWTQIDTLLVDREMINTECSCWKNAFQYADWDFDGDDLVMAVRETVGFSNTFHDGKYFTFYRVSDFRELCGLTA